jgi:hypothetical protein
MNAYTLACLLLALAAGFLPAQTSARKPQPRHPASVPKTQPDYDRNERFIFPFDYSALRVEGDCLLLPRQNGKDLVVYAYPLSPDEPHIPAVPSPNYPAPKPFLSPEGFVFACIPIIPPFSDAYLRELLKENDRQTGRHDYPEYDSGTTLVAYNSPSLPRRIFLSPADIGNPTDPGFEHLLQADEDRRQYAALMARIQSGNDNVNFPTDHTDDLLALRAFLVEALNRRVIANPDIDLMQDPFFASYRLPVHLVWLWKMLPAIREHDGEAGYRKTRRGLNRLLLAYLVSLSASAFSSPTVRWNIHLDIDTEKIARIAVQDNVLILFGAQDIPLGRFNPMTGKRVP